jgi:hypothetical protein
MATLCFLREGGGLERALAGFDIDVDTLLPKLGRRPAKYVGTQTPVIPTGRQDLTRFRQPSRTLVHVSDRETNRVFQHEGCYFLEEVEPEEANNWHAVT